ncbi:MAG: DNA repair protein RecN [Actinomycetota bacterium]|nr:MAG: DNA repair protein RecN [Actinomycetota bacterium]
MLDELHVLNIGVIEDLTVQLGPGMTVISGETGAGKTLIVDALVLLCGNRADGSLIRTGSSYARVEARFRERETESVLARQMSVGDSSRAYINNQLCRAVDLSEISSRLFHVYGQHEAQLLFSSSAQAATLDNYSEIDYSNLLELRLRLREAEEHLQLLGGDERARRRELYICQSEFDEIAAADLKDPEEEAALKEELELLSNAVEFREALATVQTLLIDGDSQATAMDQLGEARRMLAHTGKYSSIVEHLSGMIEDLNDIGRDIRMEMEHLDPDPGRLEQLHERLQKLSKLKRKYGDTLREVIDYRERVATRIAELNSFELVASNLESEMEAYRVQIKAVEDEILSLRREGSKSLATGVADRLRSLAMPHGVFEVRLGQSGIGDPVTFMFSSNPGEKLGPVAKIASGGELSRLMLAIRLLSGSDVQTMIFDEVDAGIGGKTAVSVGKALAELSLSKQVIVVTHLAQVASFARNQIAVTKSIRNGRTVTEARVVSGEDRVEELARMLSGQNESEKAKEHARELLTNANGRSANNSSA